MKGNKKKLRGRWLACYAGFLYSLAVIVACFQMEERDFI
jgi:hypothetical protein